MPKPQPKPAHPYSVGLPMWYTYIYTRRALIEKFMKCKLQAKNKKKKKRLVLMVRRHEERHWLPREISGKKFNEHFSKMLLLSLRNFVLSTFSPGFSSFTSLRGLKIIFFQPLVAAQRKQRAGGEFPAISHNIFHTSILLHILH